MLRRAALGSLVAMAAFTAPAVGQVSLQWKFKEGDKFYLEEKIVSKTMTTVMGMKNTEDQTQTRISSFVVKSRSSEGVELEQRIESWKSKVASGSSGTEEGVKLLEQVSKDVVFKIQLSASGVVKRFEGYDQMIKKLNDIDKEEAKKFKAIASEEVLRAPLAMVFDVLPPAAVKKGDTWKKEHVVPMGPMGIFKFTTTFTYVGPGEGGELISTKGVFSFQPSKADASELGFKIIKLELTQKEMTGKMIFDNAKGRLVLSETSMPLAGTMTVEVQGMELDVTLDGMETRTMRISDKKPMPDI